MMKSERYNATVNLAQFSNINIPLEVGSVYVKPPCKEQKILRMLVSDPYHKEMCLPKQLKWVSKAIEQAKRFQLNYIGIQHPFTYITVRHGKVDSVTDDMWHVDGFSTRIAHLPESNYIFTSNDPTEWVEQSFDFPEEFDPLQHNVHLFFQHRVKNKNIRCLKQGYMYHMDPYVIHRRPSNITTNRTFVRISFTPIEIPDINNTINPLISTPHYIIDGVKSFRDKLLDYDNH